MNQTPAPATSRRPGRPPVIILGMHRSGTTMTARLLAGLGLFLGRDLERNHESLFFQLRNEAILNGCHGGWDQPAPAEELWRHPASRARFVQLLRDDLASWRLAAYLGPGRFLRYRTPANLDLPWGWKDPRNSLLLPLWLELFPEAKIIHVVRNGLDVAASLARREGGGPARPAASQPKPPPAELYLRLCRRLGRLAPLQRYREVPVSPCREVAYGFGLWKHYEEQARRWTATVPPARLLRIKYEEFLAGPEAHLQELCDFCRLPAAADLGRLAATVERSRSCAFRESPELTAFYRQVKDEPLMREYGYDGLEL